MTPRFLRLALAAACLLETGLHAQVSTWIASGGTFLPAQDWADPANWDITAAPNSPTAVAAIQVFPTGQLNTGPNAGAARLAINGNITVAEIRYPPNRSPLLLSAPAILLGTGATLDVSGAGFVASSNNNFGLPNVFVNGGTLTFHNQASAGSNQLLLATDGTVVFADQSSGSALVNFNASGPSARLVVRDNADVSQLTLATSGGGTGTIDFSGAAGDVRMRGFNATLDINLGANRLTLDRFPNNVVSFLNGRITGTTGGLTFGSTLSSVVVVGNPNNDYGGLTLVDLNPSRLVLANGGRLNNVRVVNNTLININTTATIGGFLDLSAGQLMLSDSGVAATLTILGDYSQGASSVLIVNSVFFPGITITGTATLGGRLGVALGSALPPLGPARLTLLRAGLIVGTFDAGSGTVLNSPTRASHLDYTATEVQFVVDQLPFANVGTTPSQRAVGANIDANLATATGPYRDVLVRLNGFASGVLLAAALGELSPDTYGVLVEEGFTTAAANQARRDEDFAFLRRDPSARGFTFWAGGDYRRDRFDALEGLWDVHPITRSLAAGGAWRAGHWTAGLMLAKQKTTAALDRFGSQAAVKGLTTTVLLQHDNGNFFQNAAVACTASDFTLRRRVVYPTFDQTFTASPGGTRIDFAANIGSSRTYGQWEVTALAGLLASIWKIDDFAEAGVAGAPLSFRDWSTDSLRSRMGLQLGHRAGRGFTPHLGVTWLHEFQPDRTIPAAFTGATLGFISPSRPGEIDLVQASLGLDYALDHGAVFYASYGGAKGRNSSIASDVSAGFRWEF